MLQETYPLLSGYADLDAPFAYAHNLYHVKDFLSDLVEVRLHLPKVSSHIVNLCDQRVSFALGFSAALLEAKVSLFPVNRQASAVLDVLAQFPDAVCLVDDYRPDLLGVPQVSMSAILNNGSPKRVLNDDIPCIPVAQPAVCVYTSGSTGVPHAHLKTWGQLVQGARLTASLPLPAHAAVMSMVPSQHMFGLETSLIFPLQTGRAFFASQPMLPADVDSLLQQHPVSSVLISTPLQLKSFIAPLKSAHGAIHGVLSATMPLATSIAQSAAAALSCPIYDIYGSTETGMFAYRDPKATELWSTLSGVSLIYNEQETHLQTPLLDAPYLIPDVLECVDAHTFRVKGRRQDIVKIAGKRMSLPLLNELLQALPSVQDGIFYLPEDAQRLVAFVVPAPNVDKHTVENALKKQLDAAFMPRPLLCVDKLPRSGAGKIALKDLQALYQQSVSK